MPRPTANSMFALPARPPDRLEIAGCAYALELVFKHDFWAATCRYASDDPAARFPRVVVKFARQQPFLALPLQWVGRWLTDHEQGIYRAIGPQPGVPAWVGRISPTAWAIEYLDAQPLDHFDPAEIPAGFFDRLRELIDAIHARGVAVVDANKRSNILLFPDGLPGLIDFQISLRRRRDWPWPMRAIVDRLVDYLMGKDLYHLYKHKRRLQPGELTEQEAALSRRRSPLHLLHRRLTKPYRSLRRRFLRGRHEAGKLQSPTEDLETHHQPEKATWRERD